MASRWNVNAKKDKSAFTHTRRATHRINVNPKIPRGGIRL